MLRTKTFFRWTVKTLIRLNGCPGWSESSLGMNHFVGSIMHVPDKVRECGSLISVEQSHVAEDQGIFHLHLVFTQALHLFLEEKYCKTWNIWTPEKIAEIILKSEKWALGRINPCKIGTLPCNCGTQVIWARSCENVSYAICEQQRRRSACASAQSDQHLCCSLLR